MNHNIRRAYNSLTHGIYDLANISQKSPLVKSAEVYTFYLFHLTRVYGPRLSHIDAYTDAYTPRRTKYNAYIVLGLLGAFFFDEYNCISHTKSQEYERRLKARPQ